ncbi:hypothetical protein ACTU3I_14575 [Microbacterium sp. RD1]|uniref:hypothetical protein n=1 Tax=Microbacterium sp. RD1 TaxID=3457313 RepID=UPI003FA52A94
MRQIFDPALEIDLVVCEGADDTFTPGRCSELGRIGVAFRVARLTTASARDWLVGSGVFDPTRDAYV